MGEHLITEYDDKIKSVYYKEKPEVNPDVLKAIREADAIILSMGSLFTSIIPNLLCREVKDEIDNSKAKIIYVCNIMTQPGETDNFTVSDHVKLLNSYLGKKKVNVGIFNHEKMDPELAKKYETEEQKDPVILDKENLTDIEIIEDDLITDEDGVFRHDTIRLGLDIFSYLLNQKK